MCATCFDESHGLVKEKNNKSESLLLLIAKCPHFISHLINKIKTFLGEIKSDYFNISTFDY